MKNLTKVIFTLAFFGLSIICVSAQQNSTSLEETMWVATPLSYYTANYGASTATYYFKSNNQATLLVDHTIIKPPQFVVDPFTNQQKWTPAGVEPKYDENTGGTYRRTGNSVKIEFSDFIITATIKGNTMEGEYTDKNTNVKTKWAAAKNSNDTQTKESVSSSRVTTTTPNKFTVPSDSPLIGTWKYEERGEPFGIPGYSSHPGLLKKRMVAVFSSNATLEITVQEGFVDDQSVFPSRTEKTNWKYIPKDKFSGVLEQYQGDGLLFKGNVRWINSNQFEYTNTFNTNSSAVGTKILYIKQ